MVFCCYKPWAEMKKGPSIYYLIRHQNRGWDQPNILISLTLFFLFFIAGHSLLRSTMAVEKLGGWKSGCFEDGPQPGNHLRSGEKIEEETPHRIYVFKSKTSQFLGLQILLLRAARPHQCWR